MKQFYSLIFLAFSSSAFGQIAITDASQPEKDQGFEIHNEVSNPASFQLEIESPKGHSWDISSLSASQAPFISNYGDPAYTNFATEFKETGANLAAVNNGNEGLFLKVSDGSVQVVGQGRRYMSVEEGQLKTVSYPVIYDTPLDFFSYPIEVGDKYSTSGSYETDLAPYGGIGTAKGTMNMDVEVDGYGTLKMPNGNTYDVVRLKITEVDTTGFFKNNSVSYEFMTPEFSWPLVQFEIHDEGEAISFLWLNAENSSNSVENNGVNEVVAYPNPSRGLLRFDGLEGLHHFVVYNTQGKMMKRGTTTNGVIDCSELSKGVYVFKVENQDANVVLSKRIVISKE